MSQIPEKLPPGAMIVRWLCNGTPAFETMELCGLRELRKSLLHHTNGKTYKVLSAWRAGKKTMVASCWELPAGTPLPA